MAVRWTNQRQEADAAGAEEPSPAAGPSPIDWARWAAGAVWRHRLLCGVILVVGVVGLFGYYRTRIPQYRVQTRVLAQRQQSLPSIGRPTAQDDAPTRAVWDVVHRRENLVALIEEGRLLETPLPRPATGGLREWVAGLLGRSGSSGNPEEDRLQAMVDRLDRALLVTTTEATITISLDWPVPEQGYRVVEAALQNFLEARHIQEVTAMDEAISLLQGRAAALQQQLNEAIDQARGEAARRGGAARPAAAAAAARPQGEELVQLRSMLEAKERAVTDVEEFRRRRLNDLQAQLDAQKAIYSDAHPNVIALRQDVEGLSKESPQVVGLRQEIRKLRADYLARGGQDPRLGADGSAAQGAPAPAAPPEPLQVSESEPVRQARYRYQQMVERVSAAQMDLDAARSAFKYRYTVIWPAELPHKPVSPSAVKILGGGTVLTLLLAVLAALGLEFRADKVVARWQVEHSLDLPVLGEIDGKD